MTLEKFNSIHPSEEVYRMQIATTVQPIYYDFRVTNQMEVFYIESPFQVKGGPGTQQFCSSVGAWTTTECPFVDGIFSQSDQTPRTTQSTIELDNAIEPPFDDVVSNVRVD